MPDDRLARARRSLPAGYQFGDARAVRPRLLFHRGAFPFVWRRPSENAAEQLARQAHWNVIEGEDH